MKHIKLLFSISLLFATTNLKSQSFFADSACFYTYTSSINLSGGSFIPTLHKEQIFLDSINLKGEYYSVKYISPYFMYSERAKDYKLRVLDSQVFFTGYILKGFNDSFWNENLLIFDYTLNVGDTLKINFNSELVYVLIDSIATMQTLDGKLRKVQYYSPISNTDKKHLTTFNASQYYSIMGLGGTTGLLTYNKGYNIFKSLVSVCKSNQVIYKNNSFVNYFETQLQNRGINFGQTILNNACDKDSLGMMLININRLDIQKIDHGLINFFPNPAKNFITLEWKTNAKPAYVIVTDVQGKTIAQQAWDGNVKCNLITQTWPNGIYFVRILTSDNNTTIVRKVVINK